MARGPNRRTERMSHDRELHWSVKWWLRAAGKWKKLRECHQWRHKFFCLSLQRNGTQTHSSGPGSPRRLGGTCMYRGDFCIFALPASSQFSDFASSTSCGSDVGPKTVPLCSQLWRPRPAAFPSATVFASFRLGVCLSSWNADWFFGRRHACRHPLTYFYGRHQSSRKHVIKLLIIIIIIIIIILDPR